MGDVVRFPQERIPFESVIRSESAVVLILPVVRVERFDNPLLDPRTYLAIGKSFEALWAALLWPR